MEWGSRSTGGSNLLARLRLLFCLPLFMSVGACGTPGSHGSIPKNFSAIEAAELELARGDHNAALRSYDRILMRTPRDPRALLGSARARLAAKQGEVAIARFSAYAAEAEVWREVNQWEYCTAITLGAEQLIEAGDRPARAMELAKLLGSEGCAEERALELLLRAGLGLAEADLKAGRDAEALSAYLSLLPKADPSLERGNLGPVTSQKRDPALARAYQGAARLLLKAGRRDEVLALLSRGLDEFPGNRDLVHQILTVLADGSSVLFPRPKPLAPLVPVVTEPARIRSP